MGKLDEIYRYGFQCSLSLPTTRQVWSDVRCLYIRLRPDPRGKILSEAKAHQRRAGGREQGDRGRGKRNQIPHSPGICSLRSPARRAKALLLGPQA